MKSENPKLMALHFSNVDKKKFRSDFRERKQLLETSLLENVASDRILLFITHHLEIKVEYLK